MHLFIFTYSTVHNLPFGWYSAKGIKWLKPVISGIGAVTARVARVLDPTNFWETNMGPAQYCVAKY